MSELEEKLVNIDSCETVGAGYIRAVLQQWCRAVSVSSSRLGGLVGTSKYQSNAQLNIYEVIINFRKGEPSSSNGGVQLECPQRRQTNPVNPSLLF